jgi:hypothetical protein
MEEILRGERMEGLKGGWVESAFELKDFEFGLKS